MTPGEDDVLVTIPIGEKEMDDSKERKKLREVFGLEESLTEDPLALEKMAGLFGKCAKSHLIDSTDLIRTIRDGD